MDRMATSGDRRASRAIQSSEVVSRVGSRSEKSLEMKDSCRLCLRSEEHTLPIFSETEESARLRSQILDCCPIELLREDGLPRVICACCAAKLAAAYEFREQCRASERKLRESIRRSWKSTRGPVSLSTSKCFRDSCVQTEGNEKDVEEQARSVVAINRQRDGKLVRERATSAKTKKYNDIASRREKNISSTSEIRDESDDEKSTEDDPDREDARPRDRRSCDNEKRYLCDVCSKTFASMSGLRFHLKGHDGSKPHVCRYCQKGFAIPSYRKRHERTHVGDKRFVCHVCSAAFASSNGLKYHLRSHTGEANYRCDTCGKSFGRYKYLKEHVFTHTGERPFACKICGSAYGNSGSLFVHEKKCKSRCVRGEVTNFPCRASDRSSPRPPPTSLAS